MTDAREALVAVLWEKFGAWPNGPLAAWLTEADCARFADAILAAGWTPPRSVAELVTGAAHPEDVCHRCGGPNVVRWHAPSEAWNQVEQREGILCPQCFTSAYEALHPGTAWHVGPEVSGPCRYPLLTNEEPSAPPPLEDVARAILMVTQAADVDPDYAWNVQYPEVQDECLDQARAVLALFPGRTEAEVKAETWDEVVDYLDRTNAPSIAEATRRDNPYRKEQP